VADLLDDPRLTLLGLLVEVHAGLEAKLGCQLAEHGLSEVEFGVLLRLARSPGRRLRMSDLTAQTSLTNSGITRVVDRLSHADLVRREACPQDRRSIYAAVTEVGLQRVEAALPGHLDLVEKWLAGPLTDEQRSALEAVLRLVRDAISPEATAGADPRTRPDLPAPSSAGAAMPARPAPAILA
jgi:DNA-binding MarR family transcriptional regulator